MTGPIVFAHPWLLLAFLLLPALWLIVRALPPAPRRFVFPPVRLLLGLDRGDPPAARTPLWLLILRLLVAALVILALARPAHDPKREDAGNSERPLVILLDNGWETASRFAPRRALVARLLANAARAGRQAALLLSAPPPGGWPGSEDGEEAAPDPFLPAVQLARTLDALAPVPFSPDHRRLADRLKTLANKDPEIVYVSDGLVHPGSDRLLPLLDEARIFRDGEGETPYALLVPEDVPEGFALTVLRPRTKTAASVLVRAMAADGRPLGETTLAFAPDEERAQATIAMPAELRLKVARIALMGEAASAGGTMLIDRRHGRPRVGLAAGESGTAQQPFRSALFYLRRALEPLARVEEAPLAALPDIRPEAIILADVGTMPTALRESYLSYVREGGLLIRFAGPRLAAGDDGLVPVPLRVGERAVGGALSWETPQPIAPFPPGSPFFGLAPPADITVSRQVLAAPGLATGDRSWARLADGTPIVTARPEGRGMLVLFHSTASPDWTTLPLSGLFVEMLERLLLLARAPEALGVAGDASARLAPQRLLDAYGADMPPPAGIAAIPAGEFVHASVTPARPAGLYGAPASPLALNLMAPGGPIDADFRFLSAPWQGTAIAEGERTRREFAPILIGLLIVLLLADWIASHLYRGLPLLPRRRSFALLPAMIVIAFMQPMTTEAQTAQLSEDFAREALDETRFAYVISGDPAIDRLSEAGLYGLGRILALRTAVTLGKPMGVVPGRDPLALFPFLYYPVARDGAAPAESALLALSNYLASGGILLIDTGTGDNTETLVSDPVATRRLIERAIGRIDLPPLVPVTEEHVLARSFYLLDSFPGRIAGRPLWATRASSGEEPQVSPILIGAGDWAAAWAIDAEDRFLIPDLPGGMRQRERAFRVGINMAIYALTGTYKADQLHLPALLERLGR